MLNHMQSTHKTLYNIKGLRQAMHMA